MLIKTGRDGFIHPQSSEITPQAVYRQRRDMLRLMATGVAGAGLASWAGRQALAQGKLPALAGAEVHACPVP
jgi:sulfoxide reductase catalytic subunit YedY